MLHKYVGITTLLNCIFDIPMASTILLYDDNDILRESVEVLLADEIDFSVVSFNSAETVVKDINVLEPSAILMDIDMPTVNGVEAVKIIRNKFNDLPIIMLTVFDDNENIFNAICAGATGYILKRYIDIELKSALQNVLSGGAPMTGTIAKKVLQMFSRKSETTNKEITLTLKEKEILSQLVDGLSYKMIAENLSIKIDTVRFHIKNIYEKLHVHSATEAVCIAIKNKLV